MWFCLSFQPEHDHCQDVCLRCNFLWFDLWSDMTWGFYLAWYDMGCHDVNYVIWKLTLDSTTRTITKYLISGTIVKCYLHLILAVSDMFFQQTKPNLNVINYNLSNIYFVFSKYICMNWNALFVNSMHVRQLKCICASPNAFIPAGMHAAIKFLQRWVCCICRLSLGLAMHWTSS